MKSSSSPKCVSLLLISNGKGTSTSKKKAKLWARLYPQWQPTYSWTTLRSMPLTHIYHMKPLVWLRYVDDTLVVWQHGKQELYKFLDHLNSRHSAIQFTMELESNGNLPFLDVLVQKSDNNLNFSVYRKPTHTDQYLHYTSSHHFLAKNSVVNTLCTVHMWWNIITRRI